MMSEPLTAWTHSIWCLIHEWPPSAPVFWAAAPSPQQEIPPRTQLELSSACASPLLCVLDHIHYSHSLGVRAPGTQSPPSLVLIEAGFPTCCIVLAFCSPSSGIPADKRPSEGQAPQYTKGGGLFTWDKLSEGLSASGWGWGAHSCTGWVPGFQWSQPVGMHKVSACYLGRGGRGMSEGEALCPQITWKLGLGLGYGSQADREFSWYLKGPLKAWEMALRLKTHTAEAAMLFLGRWGRKRRRQVREHSWRQPLLPIWQILGAQEACLRGTLKISRNKHPTDETEAVNGVALGFLFFQHFSLETTVVSSYDACNPYDRMDSPSQGGSGRSFWRAVCYAFKIRGGNRVPPLGHGPPISLARLSPTL